MRMEVVVGPWKLCDGPLKNSRILLTPVICCFLNIHVLKVVPAVSSQTAVDDGVL